MKHIKLFEGFKRESVESAEGVLEDFVQKVLEPKYGKFGITFDNVEPGFYKLDNDKDGSGDRIVWAEVCFEPEDYAKINAEIKADYDKAATEFKEYVESAGKSWAIELLTNDDDNTVSYQITLF